MWVQAIRHPFAEFETDDLGESRKKTFHPDLEPISAIWDPGGSSEPIRGADTPTQTVPRLLRVPDASSGHDEWTVLGRRYEQVGDALPWGSPYTGAFHGYEVRLTRRTG